MKQDQSKIINPAIADEEFVIAPESYLLAQSTFDSAKIEQLLDPEFVEISPIGDVDMRDRVLSYYASDNKRPAPAMSFEIIKAIRFDHFGTIIAKMCYSDRANKDASKALIFTGSFQLHHVDVYAAGFLTTLGMQIDQSVSRWSAR